ncbi:DUF2852 domain-containing protein [Neptuniibacter sp. QD72_48]|uniref:DUF2852 domain-containing protein n=1 Tax=unclassified Neptuniibacter TaxID=2630693 RepID=UPI0039F5B74A
MSSTNYSAAKGASKSHVEANIKLDECKGHWSWANITAMALGFIVFPILGLAILLWTILGNPIQELPSWTRKKWQQLLRFRSTVENKETNNSVFNEFQQTQYESISRMKEKINRREDAFRTFRADAKRREDQQEFDAFMSNLSKSDKDDS